MHIYMYMHPHPFVYLAIHILFMCFLAVHGHERKPRLGGDVHHRFLDCIPPLVERSILEPKTNS